MISALCYCFVGCGGGKEDGGGSSPLEHVCSDDATDAAYEFGGAIGIPCDLFEALDPTVDSEGVSEEHPSSPGGGARDPPPRPRGPLSRGSVGSRGFIPKIRPAVRDPTVELVRVALTSDPALEARPGWRSSVGLSASGALAVIEAWP